MSRLLVDISTVADGNMYIPNDYTNQTVIQNRRAYLKRLGIRMDQATRVFITYEGNDFKRYHVISKEDKGLGMDDETPLIADALVTTDKNQAIFLPIADCVGAVIYDPQHEVLMVTHLGRHSTVQYGGKASVEFLQQMYDSDPSVLRVWLTPAPSQEAYPLWDLDNKGLKQAVLEQFTEVGVKSSHITDNPAETDKDSRYYSHSEFQLGRQAEDGRFAIVAMVTD